MVTHTGTGEPRLNRILPPLLLASFWRLFPHSIHISVPL